MTLPSLNPALTGREGGPGDRVQAALVVAITALVTLAMTQEPTAVPYIVTPVLVALRLHG